MRLGQMTVYMHPDFQPSQRGAPPLTINQLAEAILGKVGGDDGYTFQVHWVNDAIDGQTDLEASIGWAVGNAMSSGDFAEVRVSEPVADVLDRDERSEWDDVTIFAIGPDEAQVLRAAGAVARTPVKINPAKTRWCTIEDAYTADESGASDAAYDLLQAQGSPTEVTRKIAVQLAEGGLVTGGHKAVPMPQFLSVRIRIDDHKPKRSR